MASRFPIRSDNDVRMQVVTTPEQFMHAMAVRAICFMEEPGVSVAQAIDGNDYQATHILAYAKREPIGATRVRWFRDFAKIERTAFRPAWRSARTLKLCSDFIFDHVARKGYDKLITHAEPNFARVWEKVLGFERNPGRPLVEYDGKQPLIEMVKRLRPPADTVSLLSDPQILFRIEGHWDHPHPFEISDDS